MACHANPATCRREHIAKHLDVIAEDNGDFEARCPACGHGGFRISKPERSNRLRHIWACNCRRCPRRCDPGDIRAALLRLKISPACLGLYEGTAPRDIPPEAARRMDRAMRDIIATPHLKPADIRIIIAEALGMKPPAEYREFVKFAKSIGIGHQQAYEAARREVGRPADGPPVPGGGVANTSRNMKPGSVVKSRRSPHSESTETVETGYGNRSETTVEAPTETVEPTLMDEQDRRPAA
jgi:hypothetical protein